MKTLLYIASCLILLFANVKTFAQTVDNKEDIHTETIQSNASEKPLTRVLIIFDSSQSMLGRWDGRRKIDVARELLVELIDSLRDVENLEVGLRVYGHQSPVPPQDCNDTKLEVEFSPDNFDQIEYVLEGLVARGTTPIALSLEKGAYDFPEDKNSRNIIILITDGVEACDGDPCAVSLALQKRGVILKPFVIGLGLDVEFKDVFDCVGFYFDATDSRQFRHALTAVMDQVLNFTSAQVNLLDTKNHPTETNVAMSFHDNLSGEVRYNYMHTMNEQGNPDTVLLDILTNYKLVVHTIPLVVKDSIVLQPGIHNIIELPAPQGYLQIEFGGNNQADNKIECIVRKHNHTETLNVQNANQIEKYLTGKYDVEILSIPRKIITEVEISQSYLNKIQLPEPGELVLNFKEPVVGALLVEYGDRQEKVFSITPYQTNYSLRILPGNYRLVFRASMDKKTSNTIVEKFNIESGKQIIINSK
jgi:Ca-activated chloride channel homolog